MKVISYIALLGYFLLITLSQAFALLKCCTIPATTA